jgi:hypothetical protein
MPTDPYSNIRTSGILSVGHWAEKIFTGDIFRQFVSSTVRMVIASHYVEDNHPVIVDERNTLDRFTNELRSQLESVEPQANIPWTVIKLLIISHIHQAARIRIIVHDLDPDIAQSVFETIRETDFGAIFPGNWSD